MHIGLVQLDGDPASQPLHDWRDHVCELALRRAGDDVVVLPELWPVGGFNISDFPSAAESLDGPHVAALSRVARKLGCLLHGGSFVELGDDGRRFNTSVVFGPDGTLRAVYRKIHLFGFAEGEPAVLDGGTNVVTVEYQGVQFGLATCYDLRFPELFRLLVDAGSQVVLVCSAWPAVRAEHWRVLVRARAIESQAFVAACNVGGSQGIGSRRTAYAGSSVVLDPLGAVLAEAGTGGGAISADIDLTLVESWRARFPALGDRVLGLPTPLARMY